MTQLLQLGADHESSAAPRDSVFERFVNEAVAYPRLRD
jgi:hypothetical protein